MHILLLILGAIGTILFWYFRIGGRAHHISDAATKAANLPRQRRFAKAHGRQGLALVEGPVEAATALMISAAKSGDDRYMSETARGVIEGNLVNEMQLRPEDADGIVRQVHTLLRDVNLPETALFPMVDILRKHVAHQDALALSDMIRTAAEADGPMNVLQREFLRRYRERMDLVD